jgi:hypothetical protein
MREKELRDSVVLYPRPLEITRANVQRALQIIEELDQTSPRPLVDEPGHPPAKK